jgi:hypothetical protein
VPDRRGLNSPAVQEGHFLSAESFSENAPILRDFCLLNSESIARMFQECAKLFLFG